MKDYYGIISAFYKKVNPEKIKDIPFLLEKYKGQEEELIDKLYEKYNVRNEEIEKTDIKDYSQIITSFYKKINPDKIKNIPVLLEKYRGQEEELLTKLREQYNLDEKNFEIKESISEPESKESYKKVFLYGGLTLGVIVLIVVFFLVKRNIDIKSTEQNGISDSIRSADSIAMVQAEQQRIREDNTGNEFQGFKTLLDTKYPGISEKLNLKFEKGNDGNLYANGSFENLSLNAIYINGVLDPSQFSISTNDVDVITSYINKSLWDTIFLDYEKRLKEMSNSPEISFEGVSLYSEKGKETIRIWNGVYEYIYGLKGNFIEITAPGGD
jgi:hypothetical protein